MVGGREGPPRDPGHEVLGPARDAREVVVVQVAKGDDRLGPRGPPAQLDRGPVGHRPEPLEVLLIMVREDSVLPRGPQVLAEHVGVLFGPRVPVGRGGDDDRNGVPPHAVSNEPLEEPRE